MGIGDKEPRDAATRRSTGNGVDETYLETPDAGFKCRRCNNTGLLPVAYITVDNMPDEGVACCGCEWGKFYYEVFRKQGMKPTYYEDWPAAHVDKTLVHYLDIVKDTRERYWNFRRERGLPYRDDAGAWIDPRQQTKTTDDGVAFHDDNGDVGGTAEPERTAAGKKERESDRSAPSSDDSGRGGCTFPDDDQGDKAGDDRPAAPDDPDPDEMEIPE